jgi:hypothetical protein
MSATVKLLFSQDDVVRFQELRLATFAAIKRSLATDGHCKSYEGAFAIALPGYFDEADGSWVELQLNCYVLGPTRHYRWRGGTLGEAVSMAAADLATWISELDETESEERLLP